jgi:hypothetical protein
LPILTDLYKRHLHHKVMERKDLKSEVSWLVRTQQLHDENMELK